MKKPRRALCALGLMLLVPLAMYAGRLLPTDTRPLVAEKYAGWSGVLRLWVTEGWAAEAKQLPAWLNRCISRFEKRHPGVYVQPQYVDAGAVAAMNDSGILRPDMLLIPPGVLASPEGLAPLEAPDGLRAPLVHCGAWGDALYAVPVAMGGYLWVWNAALTDRLPDTWTDGAATLAVPVPDGDHRWDAALLALCGGQYSKAPDREESGEAAMPLPGIDLGLPGETAGDTEIAPTEAPGGEALPRRLPKGFDFDAQAWHSFINGEVAATPVTQREVRRLQALSDQGKGPDWRLCAGDAAFTDQLICFAAVARPDGDPRAALCTEFMAWLLDDACQGALGDAALFSVTEAGSGCAAGDPLATLDTALRGFGLCAPNCFDADWPRDCAAIVRKFVDGAGESWQLWRQLTARLERNPNISTTIAPE